MPSSLSASTLTREKEADIYKHLPAIFNDFSKILAAIIAVNSFFVTNENLITCLVIMIVVYFLVLVLGTVLQLCITNHRLLPILSCIMLVVASADSVLALILIEPTIAFITGSLQYYGLVFSYWLPFSIAKSSVNSSPL